ncbi:MAG: acyl-phosphate glycerol 3-phosphate acyltransferase [Sandaracinaceae bacterium]|nr:acyl-phosphate glycerol 3-phosphate acyltransferase [Sandaracinaceae bacterium]
MMASLLVGTRDPRRERTFELSLARIASVLAEAIGDPRPFDPHRLDARDPETVRALLPLFERVAGAYLRAEIEGEAHIRPGPALYVANHNGGIMGPRPLQHDEPALAQARSGRPALRHGARPRDAAHPPPRSRAPAHRRMRAHRENALRALRTGGAVLVYPGGDLDAYRPFSARDRIVFGPRAGFVRVARDAGVPIVPIVTQGAHRSAIIVHEGEWLARALGLRAFARIERCPVALALPWGLAVGPWVPYLPLPFPLRVRVLPPIRVGKDDSVEMARRRVVRAMQRALDELAARG